MRGHGGGGEVAHGSTIGGVRPEILYITINWHQLENGQTGTYANGILPPSADPWRLGQVKRQVHWVVEAVNLKKAPAV